MSLPPDRLATLRAFHLSEYVARGYLTLLDLGETDARAVSRVARIPLAKVYGVLDALQAKGLCEIFPGTPKRYAPVPIEAYIARVVAEHRRAAEALASQQDELMALFPLQHGLQTTDRGRTQTLTGRRSAMEHEARLLARATGEVVMICTPGRLLRLRKMLGELKEASDRGVPLRMLIPQGPDWASDVAAFSPLAELRVRDHAEAPRSRTVSFVCSDDTGLIIDYIPDDGSLTNGHDVGVQLGAEGMVGALQDIARALWNAAPAGPELADAATAET